MKFAPYSFSRLDTYLKCPAWFKFRYIDHVPEQPSVSLEVGRVVHEIVEKYLSHLQAQSLSTDWEYLDGLLKDISPEWAEEVKHYREGIANITFPVGAENIAIELPIAVTAQGEPTDFFSKDAFFRGKVDFCYQNGGFPVIIDWKTNRYTPTETEMPKRQLSFYAYLLSHLPSFQSDEYDVALVFLRYSKVLKTHIEPEDIDEIASWAVETVSQIEAEKNWEPAPGPHCSYCPFISYCPISREAVELAEGVEAEQEDFFSVDSPQSALKAAQLYKVLGVLRQRLGESLKDYITKNGPLDIQGERLDFWPIKRITWQSPDQKIALARLLKGAGVEDSQIWELFSTSQTKVQQVLRKLRRKDLLDAALATGSEEETTRFEFKKI